MKAKTKNLFIIACLTIYNNLLSEYPVAILGLPSEVPLNAARRSTSYPYISGDTFRCSCNFVFDETRVLFNPADVKDGDTIFILNEVTFFDYFFTKVHPKIKAKYILVSHNHDKSEFDAYLKYLDDENLAAWFGVNLTIKHPKAFPIPIGLPNNYWPHGNTKLIENTIRNPQAKNILLYMNFYIGQLDHPCNLKRGKLRTAVANIFANKPFCYKSPRKNYRDYANDLSRSKFVISPEGEGIDCYRTWEALLVGSIPITTVSNINSLFDELPVITINDDEWKNITEESLNNKYKEMVNKKYNLKKLYAEYWIEKISKLQIEIRSKK